MSLVGECSDTSPAVSALNSSPEENAGPGVYAKSRAAGVVGQSSTWIGVFGQSDAALGVSGRDLNDASGVSGEADRGARVIGTTKTAAAGVYGHTEGDGNALRGEHKQPEWASSVPLSVGSPACFCTARWSLVALGAPDPPPVTGMEPEIRAGGCSRYSTPGQPPPAETLQQRRRHSATSASSTSLSGRAPRAWPRPPSCSRW